MASLGWKGLKRTNDELVIGKAKKKKKEILYIFNFLSESFKRDEIYTHKKSTKRTSWLFRNILESIRGSSAPQSINCS